MSNEPDREPSEHTEESATSPPPPVSRPWLGPTIASAVVLVVLLVLLIPNMLIYPQDQAAAAIGPDALAQANRALEERAAELRALLAAGVCVQDGEYVLEDPAAAEARGATQDALERTFLPPLPPVARAEPGGTVPDGSATPDGSVPEGTATPEGSTPGDGSAAAESAPPGSTRALVALLNRGVVLVLTERSSGTGFFIAPNLILTNGHVADRAGERVLVVNEALGAPVAARVTASTGEPPAFGDDDFALLELEAPVDDVTPLAFVDTPDALTPVVAAGYPSLVLSFDEEFQRLLRGETENVPNLATWPGMVTVVQDLRSGSLIIHSAQTTPGNSGGPLVDRCGRVTGVNTWVVSEDTGGRLNNALGTDVARRWLSAHGVSVQSDGTMCSFSAAY